MSNPKLLSAPEFSAWELSAELQRIIVLSGEELVPVRCEAPRSVSDGFRERAAGPRSANETFLRPLRAPLRPAGLMRFAGETLLMPGELRPGVFGGVRSGVRGGVTAGV